ncbi:MAG TPA: hypothetical protein VGU22_00685 [Methylomirabilota bacterium]|jgi:hypothetical protein|nr:hypothetical protein [Methylomirabilota bacterium]
MSTDRFGNPFAPALPYARGKILTSTEDDDRKLRRAWAIKSPERMRALLFGDAERRRRCWT